MTHMLLLYPTLIPSVILCGHSQLEWLDEKGYIEYKWCSSRRVSGKLVSWADVVIFVRPDSKMEVRLAHKLKTAGKFLIFALDDDLLNVPEYINSSEYYNNEKTRRNILEMLSMCDCLLSPSDRLLEKYGADSSVVRIKEPSLVHYEREEVTNDPVRIGFAGSNDRSRDIDDLLADVIDKLLRNYGRRISVEFFGAKPSVVDRLGLKYIPYCESYEKYLKVMSSLNWDIGLAPMPETEFHASKYYNKYIEYAGYGIVGVYSAVEPYVRAISNEVNGLICANTGEAWYSAISRLIEDSALRRRISKKCISEAQHEFSLEVTAKELRDALGDTLNFVSDKTTIRGVGLLVVLYWCQWFVSKFGKYGLQTPVIALKKLKAKLLTYRTV